MIVVDTDILIWLLRGNQDIADKFIDLAENTNGNIFITPIQIAEICAGIRKNEEEDTEIFFRRCQIINIDFNIGKQAGIYMSLYKKSHNVTIADSLIAATAKMKSFKIWTLNKKHYPMFSIEEFI